MSDLHSAMLRHMDHIVEVEHRLFCFNDFQAFKVDGKEYKMAYGTFRNKISCMLQEGQVECVYYSPQGFYTLKGSAVNPSTDDRIGVPLPLELRYITNDPLYRSIRIIPFGQKSLHNIRLRFEVKGIWNILSCNSEYRPNPRSKDIKLPRIVIDKLGLDVNIHRTDTVSVIVSCSYAPVAVDVNGVIRLSNALAKVKEMLSNLIRDCSDYDSKDVDFVIPDHMSWIVTMWHFGADSLAEYAGETYHRRWEVAVKLLFTIYTKKWKNGKSRIRWDCQEYPNKPVREALEEKLGVK